MIRHLSSSVTKWLLRSGAISAEETELYDYAISLVVLTLAPLVLAAAIGAMMGMLPESMLMILPFLFLRKFSGGFHLESPFLCFVSSVSLLTLFLWVIRAMTAGSATVWFLSLLLASLVILTVFSPIDSEARRLTGPEKKLFRKIAILLAYLFAACSILLLYLGIQKAAFSIGAGVILTAFLQVPCLIQRLFHS